MTAATMNTIKKRSRLAPKCNVPHYQNGPGYDPKACPFTEKPGNSSPDGLIRQSKKEHVRDQISVN
jgi:hypothetical protein